MISRKTIISLALVFVMAFSCAVSYADTSGSGSESEAAAEQLYMYGLFKGSVDGFDLEGTTSKEEAGVMVVRLLGAEDDALSGVYTHPYKDITGWSSDYIGYLYENEILGDEANGLYEPKEDIDAVSYLKMILNVLGYINLGEDLTNDQMYTVAVSAGLITQSDTEMLRKESFTRGDLALISYDALNTKICGETYTLFEYLDRLGVIENLAAPTDEIKYGAVKEEPVLAKEDTSATLAATVVANAKQYVGVRYRSGGKSPSTGFDCSGYVGYVMIQSGAWGQFYGSCDGVITQCTTVSKEQAQPGDLVFFKNTYNTSKTYTHVGIYLGNNQMIHASSSKGVIISSIASGYWAQHYACIARPNVLA